jgi:hypothetical protein
MAISALRQPPQVAQFTGRTGPGPCILPGAPAGAQILAIINNGTGSPLTPNNPTGTEAANFEKTLSQGGQIQQTATGNLSANEYWAIWII